MRSGVFRATLTVTNGGEALSKRNLRFSVNRTLTGSPELGNKETNKSGTAVLDLKQRPLKFLKTVTNDKYTATFAGDGTYCYSSDTGSLDVARVQ